MQIRPTVRRSLVSPLLALGLFGSAACERTPEPIQKDRSTTTQAQTSSASSSPASSLGSSANASSPTPSSGVVAEQSHGGGAQPSPVGTIAVGAPKTSQVPVSPDDPLKGVWGLEDAQKVVPGAGPFVATIDTSKGTIQCKLLDDRAPLTVANFVGLATGKRTWRDPRTKKWGNAPAYDNTSFHRVIQGFMIQGGDAAGSGMGEPGYVIPDELWTGAKHDRAGLLCMANRGPNTNGAQFFITDAKAAHLDAGYTIFGECAPVDVIHQIAGVDKDERDKPTTPVAIKKVSISRGDKKK